MSVNFAKVQTWLNEHAKNKRDVRLVVNEGGEHARLTFLGVVSEAALVPLLSELSDAAAFAFKVVRMHELWMYRCSMDYKPKDQTVSYYGADLEELTVDWHSQGALKELRAKYVSRSQLSSAQHLVDLIERRSPTGDVARQFMDIMCQRETRSAVEKNPSLFFNVRRVSCTDSLWYMMRHNSDKSWVARVREDFDVIAYFEADLSPSRPSDFQTDYIYVHTFSVCPPKSGSPSPPPPLPALRREQYSAPRHAHRRQRENGRTDRGRPYYSRR